VQSLAVPLLAHRVVLTPAAEIEGQASTGIVEEIVTSTKAPK
jgi:MoxR-like ATPase